MKKDDIEAIQFDAHIKGIDLERERILGIINYILKKNTTFQEDLWTDTIDYEKLYADLLELRDHLRT